MFLLELSIYIITRDATNKITLIQTTVYATNLFGQHITVDC